MLCVFCPVCHILFSVFPSVLQRHLRLHIYPFRVRPVRLPAFCLSGLALSHMIPPEEITDTQIGVAIWLLLWWIASSFAGSLVTMGLYQHADWWNLVQYSGPRTPLPHIREYPVRRRKSPQKPPLSDEKHRPNNMYEGKAGMGRVPSVPPRNLRKTACSCRAARAFRIEHATPEGRRRASQH